MRRGGRGSIAQAPRTGHDGAIPSAVQVGRRVRDYGKVIVLAGCSLVLLIIFWSLRRPEPHRLGRTLQPRNSGFVFPLYRQYSNGSCLGGHGRWRRRRPGILSSGDQSVFELRGGHRHNALMIEQFYIEMNLGDPPKPFYFHIDTGSGPLWVYCRRRGQQSTVSKFGPHGLFVPEDGAYVKCTGATASLCQTFQATEEACDEKYQYVCFFSTSYAEGSTFLGYVVNGSITLPMRDRTERNVFSLFGCVVQAGFKGPMIDLQPGTDGIIGLGNCKGTLMDQLWRSNVISHNFLGVCMAKGVEFWTVKVPPAQPVGYISLGMDFKDKFKSDDDWVKLIEPGTGILCAYAAKLLYISFRGRRITITDSRHEAVGMAMLFDTGSDLTYLIKHVYDQVLHVFDTFASDRAYVRAPDNTIYSQSEQRACWEVPAKNSFKESPISDFGPLKLGFEGISTSTKYLIIQPVNYLTYDETERKVCVNILIDPVAAVYPVSNLGAEVMRENLFVFDVENQRVRWTTSTNCEL